MGRGKRGSLTTFLQPALLSWPQQPEMLDTGHQYICFCLSPLLCYCYGITGTLSKRSHDLTSSNIALKGLSCLFLHKCIILFSPSYHELPLLCMKANSKNSLLLLCKVFCYICFELVFYICSLPTNAGAAGLGA